MVGRTVFRPILGLCLSDGLRCARIPSPLHPLDETKPWECTRRAMPPLQTDFQHQLEKSSAILNS